ncbi:MAG: membrane dipeptidase [Granulosicoccus sp.]|jgi:membrane dipeptidase
MNTTTNVPANLPLALDGHNDLLSRLYADGGVGAAESFINGRATHLDLDRCRAGGFAGGFFAIYVPSPGKRAERDLLMQKEHYDLPLPTPIDVKDALPVALHQAAILVRLEQLGALTICTTVADIQACMNTGVIAAIMHIEGCEVIDPDFHSLEILYRAGLRSLGPVWSRHTLFAEGVPFRFPSSPDTGNGLTQLGVELVKRCNNRGILVDLSHINEAGFWDVAKYSTKPLVATHSNAHVLCEHARNLTEKQLAAIAESDGMVGVNFGTAFLRPDGRKLPDVKLSVVLRHFDHLISFLGEDRVGFGSDFDGTVVPDGIGDVAGLVTLREAMKTHGYNGELMQKLCHGNWLRVLEKTWATTPTIG